MDALVMCGGRGTRLDSSVEKPLVEIGGRPMIDRVFGALRESKIDVIHAVVSPHVPATCKHVREAGVSTIEAPGEGYVADLDVALDEVGSPVLTVAADLPLLAESCVNTTLHTHNGGSLTVCVPAPLKEALDVSVDTTFERGGQSLAPAGVNIVGDGANHTNISWDARFAVNVNRTSDIRVAETLLSGRPER